MDENKIKNPQQDKLQQSAQSALEKLRTRLLDLGARNRLINFYHTKSASLRVIDELPNQLAATLLADKEMRFKAIPEPTEEELIAAGYLTYDEIKQELVRLRNDPNAEEWARHLGFATSYEVPEYSSDDDSGKHTDTAIQTLFYPYEMEARLKSLLQKGESAIQEMGANILYLAFGFLEWYDNASSDKPRFAPLFLMPVRLLKGKLNPRTRTYEYRLVYSGEDIIPNLSLREKLRADFALALPELDENTVPEEYFEIVQELIETNQPRWRIRRYISLALLNFSKLLMYLDLDPEKWPKDSNIINHPVISRFLSGYGEDEESDSEPGGDLGFGEEYLIDEMDEVHDRYPLIEDADSSQHSALIDAVDGKNLVIEGPPGTGKSQTITNLIAASIGQGKRVLFVAEKLAALEVVRCKLDKAGLGDFCLELHSHKSQKRKVLDEIDIRLKNNGHYRPPKDIDIDIREYEERKEKLKAYADKINKEWKKTGNSLHEIFTGATRYRNAIEISPETLHDDGIDGVGLTKQAQRYNSDLVEDYRKIYQAVAKELGDDAELQAHYWFGVLNTDIQLFNQDQVTNSLSEWQQSLNQVLSISQEMATSLNCETSSLIESIDDARSILQQLKCLPILQGDELLDMIPVLQNEMLTKVQHYLQEFEGIQESYTNLQRAVGSEVLQDLSIVEQLLTGSEQLQSMVGRDIQMGKLSEAINRLDAISLQLNMLDEHFSGVSTALGKPAESYLKLSESGLNEFKILIELISSLSPSLWKHRDDIFDNDEMDEVLPELRNDLEDLRELSNKLDGVFKLEDLPAKPELLQLSETVQSGGAFRWMSGRWRAARKALLVHAANDQVKFSSMLPLLEDISSFSGKRILFESKRQYKETLGKLFQGIDTELEDIERLRGWYHSVRKEYGIGFGQKVALGDAILELQSGYAKAVRSLAERGITKDIDDVLDDLSSLREVFAPVSELRETDSVLAGPDGVIKTVSTSVRAAIGDCKALAGDDGLSLADLADQIDLISVLKDKVDLFNNADLDNKIFQGRLGLEVGCDVENLERTSTLRNTLSLAASIDRGIENSSLTDFIYQNLEKTTFSTLSSYIGRLGEELSQHDDLYNTYQSLVLLDYKSWTLRSGERLKELMSRNQSALENVDALQNWLAYVRQRKQLKILGFSKLADAVEQDQISIDQVEDAYNAAIYDVLAREILREIPELNQFSGHSQRALQEKFREYDNKLKDLQREQIAWKVDQTKVPVGILGARVKDHTNRKLLEAECNKKKRHIPIRQLLLRAGDALVALKPCFMMGPMSVAQYLAPGKLSFDLVVMDEASQIKPQDALGAVARGGQLVVVGDPKQLPPTSFFDRIVEDDDEDPTGIQESESILDATLPMFPARRLRWHYRSQHEKLIAFSNHSFYESNLVVFPSPHKDNEGYGIKYSRIPNGSFVNRRNMEEAKIISEAVREHFKQRPEESLGVVAMSADQRTQIERAIETLAKEDDTFRETLEKGSATNEPLFIKNLENVQGDERDVIFISMTYGPQEPGGKVRQHFGPINSEMGWRRLNVLFTRSKKRMHIFSSLGSADIVIGPASKRGVQALRDFLGYCETGILHSTTVGDREPDSDFEISVMEALRKEGFECIPQVGVAGFFIDISVIDPENPGKYLMGIECDGAAYHSAKSVRDRDRLRQDILERLGWRIRRIWSTDWFRNPDAELKPIINELNKLKSPVVESVDDEVYNITQIIEDADEEESLIIKLAFTGSDLRDRLIHFDKEVIRKKSPDIPENERLLRPAMLEALLEFQPTSKVEFLEEIPSYIRQATNSIEGEFLEQVFDIINASIVECES